MGLIYVSLMPAATTQGVKIEVQSSFVPEQSAPETSYFFFSYKIQITNLRDSPVQLLSRHWIITDGHGRVQEVRGEGVIGVQPVIEPGHMFEYSSFCPLETPTGMMKGSYEMNMAGGENFEVTIPSFFLVEPSSFN
jgi:ApaG protein